MAEGQPQLGIHFTPISASWMNTVEGFFSKLSRQRHKNAIFNSLDECITAIEGYIEHHNTNDARPFRWSKEPEDLVEAWKKGHQKLKKIGIVKKITTLARRSRWSYT